MEENKRYYWIKLKTDFFNQDTIDFLLSQKNGCEYVVLYQMLCLKTANSNGRMATEIGEMIVPYDIQKIARDTKYFSVDTVTIALELYKRLGLIYEESDGVYRISGLAGMIGSESASRGAEKKRAYRAKLDKSSNLSGQIVSKSDDDLSDRDKSIEIRDKSIEIRDKSIEKENNESQSTIFAKDVVDLYHSICVSLPKVTAPLSYNTRRDIAERVKNDGYDAIKAVFEKAEASDFLTGRIQKGWTADLHWLMIFSNFCKVLEDKYKNRGGEDNAMDTETSASTYKGHKLTGITIL